MVQDVADSKGIVFSTHIETFAGTIMCCIYIIIALYVNLHRHVVWSVYWELTVYSSLSPLLDIEVELPVDQEEAQEVDEGVEEEVVEKPVVTELPELQGQDLVTSVDLSMKKVERKETDIKEKKEGSPSDDVQTDTLATNTNKLSQPTSREQSPEPDTGSQPATTSTPEHRAPQVYSAVADGL